MGLNWTEAICLLDWISVSYSIETDGGMFKSFVMSRTRLKKIFPVGDELFDEFINRISNRFDKLSCQASQSLPIGNSYECHSPKLFCPW